MASYAAKKTLLRVDRVINRADGECNAARYIVQLRVVYGTKHSPDAALPNVFFSQRFSEVTSPAPEFAAGLPKRSYPRALCEG